MNIREAPQNSQDISSAAPDTKSLTPKGVENLKSLYKDHLEAKRSSFETFAGKNAPHFSFSTDGSIPTAVFKVHTDGSNPEVIIGLDFFVENNLSLPQTEWVMMHELSHFKDFDTDPNSYLERFRRSEHLGRDLADKLAQAYKEKYGEELPDGRKLSIAAKLGKIYSSGYSNVVDDIWVNHTVEGNAMFAKGTRGDTERERLYQKVLAPNKNLSYHSFESYQYLYAMLRGENVNEGFRITEGAEVALAKTYKLMGKDVNTQDIIDIYLNPQLKERKLGTKQTDGKTRHTMLGLTLLPTYSDLLFNDMMRELDAYHDDPQKDIDKELDELLKFFEKMFPDFIPHDVIEEWSKHKHEIETKEKEAEPANKEGPKTSPQEKAEKLANKEAKEWRDKYEIPDDLHVRVKRVEEDIHAHIRELDELWRAISMGMSLERRKGTGGLYKTGNQVNLPSFVRQFPKVVSGRIDRLQVMERNEMVEQAVNKPERIEMTLILDRSGSTFSDNGFGYLGMESQKNKAIERVTLLVMKSLERFNQFVDSTREETKTKLFADTEIILYGNIAEIKKPFRGDGGLGKDRVEQYKVMGALNKDYGVNNEVPAFRIVNNDTLAAKQENIEHKKLLKIAILITDGGTHPTTELLAEITELEKKGVHVHAIQIGDVSDEELKLFEKTWNAGRRVALGHMLGNNIGKLTEVITKMLEDELGDVEV